MAYQEDLVEIADREANGYEYETVAASQTAQVIGATGAAGDYLHRVIVDLAGGSTTILDNATTVLTLTAIGVYDIQLKSVSGAWKITTAAGTTCVAIGNFT